MFRAFQNLPIGFKTSAASAMLLLCVVGLGADALLVMNSVSSGLRELTNRNLPKQKMVLAIETHAISTHVNVFRYVAWSSSGVNPRTLQSLNTDILTDSNKAKVTLAALEKREDLSEAEHAAVRSASSKWARYAIAVADTTEIATTDPALGTMMLGGTDEDYRRVAADLEAISSLVTGQTMSAARDLVQEADRSKLVIASGGALAVLLGFGVTVLITRSLVKPIQAVTRAMRAVSVGESRADLGPTERRDEVGQMVNAIARFRDQIERDNRLLATREQELIIQNTRFDAALSNMSQGLAMFDAQRGLIVCNAKYAEIYRVSSDLLKPGMTQQEVLQLRVDNGLYAGPDPEQYIQSRAAVAAEERDCDLLLELSDGRTIAVSHRVMSDGGWVSTHEDATERCKAEQRIAHMARHDALTDLPNRLYFREQLEQALATVRRGETLAILCIDLDHFKEVNDTLGHPAGDALLIMVAERLRKCVRETDTIARLGGDEFAVIQRSINRLEDVAAAARRIVATLGEPYERDGHEMLIGTSIGIALAPADGSSADQLLRNADMALYLAKADGRRTYRFFEPQMDARLQARHVLEVDLHKALQHDEFELHYQPIVNLRSSLVTGFEALIRWNHPDRGMVFPAEFIPLAEEIGLITGIGDWVLRRACAEAATWPESFHIAINLSPAQFRNRTLVQSLRQTLAASGLQPSRVELEITESVLLQDNEITNATLHQLRELGVRISLDDFGTGYSSLSNLLRFPFDKIKIDRSFVKNVDSHSDCAAIVRAITTLASSLGISTTAEGVETRAQLDRLRAEGCVEGQGYFFSRARPAPDLGPLLAPSLDQRAA